MQPPSDGTVLARGFDWSAVRFDAKRVGDFAHLVYGKALVESNRRPGPVRVFGTNGQCGWHDTPLSDGPGVICGRKGQGHLGVKWSAGPFWVIDTAYYAQVSAEVDLRWFYYTTNYVGLDHLKTGGKPGLPRDLFERQMFPLPPLAEQQAIAEVLGALDDKIELNRRMNRTLEEMASALFRSWFIDFDPVVAKADGRAPFGMDPETAALFPDAFVDSEEGPIPEGWAVRSLPDLMQINPRRRLSKGELAPYLSMSDAPTRGHAPEAIGQREKGSGATFINGDTLLAKITPCLENGKTAFVDFLEDGEVGWGSTEFIVLRPHEPWPPVMGYMLARNREFRAYAMQIMEGSSGRQRVPLGMLNAYPLVVSSDERIARALAERCEPWFERAGANARESRTLAALRDTLLPQLLSGTIRLRDAERQVGEA